MTETGRLIEIDPDFFWVFIDETGQEHLKDKNFPVFGIGGCAVLGKYYHSELANPWYDLKDKYFDGRHTNLHACDLRNPTSRQLYALNAFFKDMMFSRFASVLSINTLIDPNIYIEDTAQKDTIHEIVVKNVLNRIAEVAKYHTFKKIIIIREESQRTDKLVFQHMKGMKFKIERSDFHFYDSPLIFNMAKSEREPGLEVADFIIHTAGTQVKRNMSDKKINERKDFKIIFRDVDSRLESFMEITGTKK